MEQNFTRPDLLPITVPDFVLWLLALGGIALWVVSHIWLKRRKDSFRPRNRYLMVFPIATVASWAVIQCLGRYFFLACYFHVFFLALLSAASIEGVAILRTASMPSSGKSTTSTLLIEFFARIAAGPPIEPR